jgi:S-adenosylmethionine-diacylgycerolhomoserine-N-methlytransferase
MSGAADGHAARMDRNYRFQRHIYDATRKHYLIGRDALIDRLAPPPDARVLEIGCGTASNLVAAAQRYPFARFYGLDISAQMLATAQGKIAQRGLAARIRTARGDAAAFDAAQLFGAPSFDRIFFSYSLSMIPDWRGALDAAAAHLSPGGVLHIVDFGTMTTMPALAKTPLRAWLSHFSVTPRDDLDAAMRALAQRTNAALTTHVYRGGYAVHVQMTRRG